MRVLVLHNRYRQAGGEERAVDDLVRLLRDRGHEVMLLERASEDATRAGAARALVAGGARPHEVARAVQAFGADVVHAHNVQPLYGWRALAAARAAGARTVLHLHNYRLVCAVAVAFRDGHRCYECHGRDTLPGVRHRCRGSLPEAAAYGAGLSLQQPRILREADALVTVSEGAARRLAAFGLPRERLSVLHNFVAEARLAASSDAGAGRHALVAGRLVPEKGYDTAIAAARAAGVPLVVAGDGPDGPRLRTLAAGADVTFTGRVPPERVRELLAGAAVALVPSRWDEPLPYGALDAVAAGVPALVSDRGGLPEIVGDRDCVLAPDDPAAWARALGVLWSDPARRAARGEAALARARERFAAGRYYDALLGIYGVAQGWVP